MKKLWLLILIFLLTGCKEEAGSIGKISCNQMRELENALLVDVRTKSEYEEAHLDKAQNIPLDNLEKEASNLDKNKPIIVYCKSGIRSHQAALKLQTLGFKSIYDLGSMESCKN